MFLFDKKKMIFLLLFFCVRLNYVVSFLNLRYTAQQLQAFIVKNVGSLAFTLEVKLILVNYFTVQERLLI